jgi:hypothetical protein
MRLDFGEVIRRNKERDISPKLSFRFYPTCFRNDVVFSEGG